MCVLGTAFLFSSFKKNVDPICLSVLKVLSLFFFFSSFEKNVDPVSLSVLKVLNFYYPVSKKMWT